MEANDPATEKMRLRGGALTLAAMLLTLNLGVFAWSPEAARGWLTALEYDGQAIQHGQPWRLLTGNLVHFDVRHFFLDVGVFFVLGWLYEPHFRRAFPWLLLTMCAGIGLTCLSVYGENLRMRGLSGDDAASCEV